MRWAGRAGQGAKGGRAEERRGEDRKNPAGRNGREQESAEHQFGVDRSLGAVQGLRSVLALGAGIDHFLGSKGDQRQIQGIKAAEQKNNFFHGE